MNHETLKVKFTVDPSRKDTWTSDPDIGEVRKERSRYYAYPSWNNQHVDFRKRAFAEWWLKVAYAAAHREVGVLYKKGEEDE